VVLAVVLAAAAVAALPPAAAWVKYRRGHSLTDDAFVETHIVNVAPEGVSGRVVRFAADENDRVEAGQVLAEIDPTSYRDQVEVAKAKLATAEAELKRQEISLARLKVDVPLQIEIAKRTLAGARADRAKADESLRVTEDEVERGSTRPRRPWTPRRPTSLWPRSSTTGSPAWPSKTRCPRGRRTR
jgi:membrane fusion protein (multidrug efflux system)